MKFNKKIVIPTLMTAAAVAMVGSVAGTFAWYQYSTRTTALFVGTSAGASHNLRIKVGDGEYKADLSVNDINTYLTSVSNNANLVPITTGVHAKDAALGTFYGNPVYEYVDMADWLDVLATDYVTLPLKVKLTEMDSSAVQNKKVYISDLEIKSHAGATVDISSAIRVHFSASTAEATFSNGTAELVTHGSLDMNGDGEVDKEGFYYGGTDTRPTYDYGSKKNGVDITSATNKQTAYLTSDTTLFPDDTHPELVVDDTTNICLGQTDAQGELAINVTIWLEGWQSINSKNCWDVNTLNQSIDVGMRFCVDAVDRS